MAKTINLSNGLGNESVLLSVSDNTLTVETVCHGSHSTIINVNEWDTKHLIKELEELIKHLETS